MPKLAPRFARAALVGFGLVAATGAALALAERAGIALLPGIPAMGPLAQVMIFTCASFLCTAIQFGLQSVFDGAANLRVMPARQLQPVLVKVRSAQRRPGPRR